MYLFIAAHTNTFLQVDGHFVYGFSSEGFSYFLFTQRTRVYDRISKLVRVCQNDSNYYSYTAVSIQCSGDHTGVIKAYLGKAGPDLAKHFSIAAQDDVLYGVFGETYNTPGSAICVYALKSIRRTFTENIQACFNGNGSLGFEPWQKQCVPNQSQTITEDFCGTDINHPLDGKLPIAAAPVAMFETKLTAVAATQTTDHTVVFAGTKDGYLKKLFFQSPALLHEYATIPIQFNSSIRDVHFDNGELNLYVINDKEVSKVKVYDCAVHLTCFDCLNGADPNCGWCILRDRCSLRSDCNLAQRRPVFLSPHDPTQRCPIIKGIVPHRVQRTTATTVSDQGRVIMA